jgi:shikimate kinase
MNPDTRAAIKAKGVSIWLNADFDVLMRRIKRRQDRPLLRTEDPAATLKQLIEAGCPTFLLADYTVLSRDVPHETIVDEIVTLLYGRLVQPSAPTAGAGEGGQQS